MTIFSAAAAAALEISHSSLVDGVYSYHAVLKLDVATSGRKAPTILSLVLAKMQLDEPTIVFTDGQDHHIDNDALPTDKMTFDSVFAVTTNRNSLHCHLIVKTARTFHQLKVGVWDLLKEHKVWLDKSPGPISKTDLVPMGFWLHVHPGFASTRSFHHQLTQDIAFRYSTSSAVKEFNLPIDFSEPDVYFTPSQCTHLTLPTKSIIRFP